MFNNKNRIQILKKQLKRKNNPKKEILLKKNKKICEKNLYPKYILFVSYKKITLNKYSS